MEHAQLAPPDDDQPEDGLGHRLLERRFLALLREGQPEDAYRLISAHLTRLRGYLDCYYGCELGGTDGIEEILHETAWKAVESAGSYSSDRGGLPFCAWRIGVNLAKDRIRSNRARRSREQEAARSERQETDELTRAVHEAINSLSGPLRTIMTYDLEHQGRGPAKPLAAILGVQVQTIYNLRNQARAQLRALL